VTGIKAEAAQARQMRQGAFMSNSPALHFHGSATIAGTSIFDPLILILLRRNGPVFLARLGSAKQRFCGCWQG